MDHKITHAGCSRGHRRRSAPGRRTAVLAGLVLALLAGRAFAAEPESGKVSKASPKVTWTGAVTSFQSWQLYNLDVRQCLPPSCDTFQLEVADGPATLNIRIASKDSPSYVEVIGPDGSSRLFGSSETVKATIRNAASGNYTINVAQNEQVQATHEGTAELFFSGETVPTPTPTPTPTPGAAPTLAVKTTRAKRGRSIRVRLQSSATLTNVKAVLLKGKRRLATGALARLEGAGTIRLRAKKKTLQKGRYTLRASGTDEQGRPVAGKGTLTLR